jgi:hypothetical protein
MPCTKERRNKGAANSKTILSISRSINISFKERLKETGIYHRNHPNPKIYTISD